MRITILITLALFVGAAMAQDPAIMFRDLVANDLHGITIECPERFLDPSQEYPNVPACFRTLGNPDTTRTGLQRVVQSHDDLEWIQPWHEELLDGTDFFALARLAVDWNGDPRSFLAVIFVPEWFGQRNNLVVVAEYRP